MPVGVGLVPISLLLYLVRLIAKDVDDGEDAEHKGYSIEGEAEIFQGVFHK